MSDNYIVVSRDHAGCFTHVSNGRSVRRIPDRLIREHGGSLESAWAAVPEWRRRRRERAAEDAERRRREEHDRQMIESLKRQFEMTDGELADCLQRTLNR